MERFCVRCDDVVQGEYEDPGARKLAKIYFSAGLIYLPFLPIIGADIFIMIPNLALYCFGAGAAMRYWNQAVLCSECGAETQAERTPPALEAHGPPYRSA